eukprot:TRINITY_DN10466_c0_g1_i1.p1 TRINITY_DN10466_c0_g1~~TRINITY_DN10466_c0_g1_i1.p1  ORF type:complete len:319 (-),score=46.33 TRINITY_DN10466_c0_g1_i1:72-1028(-)
MRRVFVVRSSLLPVFFRQQRHFRRVWAKDTELVDRLTKNLDQELDDHKIVTVPSPPLASLDLFEKGVQNRLSLPASNPTIDHKTAPGANMLVLFTQSVPFQLAPSWFFIFSYTMSIAITGVFAWFLMLRHDFAEVIAKIKHDFASIGGARELVHNIWCRLKDGISSTAWNMRVSWEEFDIRKAKQHFKEGWTRMRQRDLTTALNQPTFQTKPLSQVSAEGREQMRHYVTLDELSRTRPERWAALASSPSQLEADPNEFIRPPRSVNDPSNFTVPLMEGLRDLEKKRETELAKIHLPGESNTRIQTPPPTLSTSTSPKA